MSKKYEQQYDTLGLEAPENEIDPREKAEVIFYAACKKLSLDPTALPQVQHLGEDFRPSLIASYKLQVIRKALTDDRKPNYDDYSEEKWGAYYLMNKPGFRLDAVFYGISTSLTHGGPRLCTFSEEDQEFFSTECVALWADLSGGQLPVVE